MRAVTAVYNTQCPNCLFFGAHLGDLLLRRVDLLGNAAELEVGLGEDGLHVGPQVQQAPLQAQLPLLILAFLVNIISSQRFPVAFPANQQKYFTTHLLPDTVCPNSPKKHHIQ